MPYLLMGFLRQFIQQESIMLGVYDPVTLDLIENIDKIFSDVKVTFVEGEAFKNIDSLIEVSPLRKKDALRLRQETRGGMDGFGSAHEYGLPIPFIPKSKICFYPSVMDDKKVDDCFAQLSGRRNEFQGELGDIDPKTYQQFILFHEYAHLLQYDKISKNKIKNLDYHQGEISADFFAGGAMAIIEQYLPEQSIKDNMKSFNASRKIVLFEQENITDLEYDTRNAISSGFNKGKNLSIEDLPKLFEMSIDHARSYPYSHKEKDQLLQDLQNLKVDTKIKINQIISPNHIDSCIMVKEWKDQGFIGFCGHNLLRQKNIDKKLVKLTSQALSGFMDIKSRQHPKRIDIYINKLLKSHPHDESFLQKAQDRYHNSYSTEKDLIFAETLLSKKDNGAYRWYANTIKALDYIRKTELKVLENLKNFKVKETVI